VRERGILCRRSVLFKKSESEADKMYIKHEFKADNVIFPLPLPNPPSLTLEDSASGIDLWAGEGNSKQGQVKVYCFRGT